MGQPRVLNMRHLRGRELPAGARYVGRPTKWGNPFRIGTHGHSRDDCIAMYAEEFGQDPEFLVQVREELAGFDLVCWCAPQPCHADLLLLWANEEVA